MEIHKWTVGRYALTFFFVLSTFLFFLLFSFIFCFFLYFCFGGIVAVYTDVEVVEGRL